MRPSRRTFLASEAEGAGKLDEDRSELLRLRERLDPSEELRREIGPMRRIPSSRVVSELAVDLHEEAELRSFRDEARQRSACSRRGMA
jgi:hypothetical protein